MPNSWKSLLLLTGLSGFFVTAHAATWGDSTAQTEDSAFLRDIIQAKLEPSSQKWQNQYNGETHHWQVHKTVQRPVGTQTERWLVFSRAPSARNAMKNQVFGLARLVQESGNTWRLKQIYPNLHQPNAQSTGTIRVEFRMIGPKTFLAFDNAHQTTDLSDKTRYLFDPFSGKGAGNMTLSSRGSWANGGFLDCQTTTASFIKQTTGLPNVELGQECNTQNAKKTQQKLVYAWQNNQYILKNGANPPNKTPNNPPSPPIVNNTPSPKPAPKTTPWDRTPKTTLTTPKSSALMDSIPNVSPEATTLPPYSAPLKKQSVDSGSVG